MDVEKDTAGDSSPYPALFREYVLRSAQKNLSTLQSEAAKREWPLLERAVHALGYALELDSGWATARDLLLLLSPELERTGLRDEWIPYLQRGIQHSTAREEWAIAAELLLQLGLLYQLVGEYDRAVKEYDQAIGCSERANDKQLHAQSLNWLAFQLYLMNEYDRAIKLVVNAQYLLDETDPERSASFRVLGRIAFAREEWFEAECNFREMHRLSLSTHNERRIAYALRDLGPALHVQGKYEEAISCQEKAMSLFRAAGDNLQEAVTLMNLGSAYCLMQQYDKALACYHDSVPLFRDHNDNLHLAITYHNIGYVLVECDDLDIAADYYQRSVRIRTGLNDYDGLIESIQDLGKIHLRTGDYEQASERFRQAIAIIESQPDNSSIGRYRNEAQDLFAKAISFSHVV